MNLKKANILAKSLFKGSLFGEEAGLKVVHTIAQTVTRTCFNGRSLLKAVDLKAQGSLNDSGVHDYYKVED